MARKTGTLEQEVQHWLSRCRRDGECLMGPTVGYGEIHYDGGRRMSAHRAVVVASRGPIPSGLVVRHTCDRIGCVESSHLVLGTPADNNRDKVERGRTVRGLAHHRAVTDPLVIKVLVAQYLAGAGSQAEIARLAGVSQVTFGRWVRGEIRADSGVEGRRFGKGLRPAGSLKPCGTVAAYHRHIAKGQHVCEPCRQAHRAYMRKYKADRRGAA